MAAEERWYFAKDQLANTPSRRCGIDADKELSYRQQAANFIQDMGQRLKVTQLCINTAIVYMHRFYMFHSFTVFHRNSMSTASLFLAAKVEEQPRKLEHVITVAHWCLNRDREEKLDTKSELYQENAQELVFNENVLLQTLGFDVGIDHPHTHVVKCCHLVRANKELAQTSYFMASNSLHLTTMCLQYKPTLVACFCIHLACKWSNWEIPQSSEGKEWFLYVDPTVTLEQLELLTAEFLVIYDKCPSRLKKMNSKRNEESLMSGAHALADFDSRKSRPGSSGSSGRPEFVMTQRIPDDVKKQHPHQSRVDYQQYREKKQREAAAAAAAGKEGRPQPPPHHMPRPPLPTTPSSSHHQNLKREQMKRDMARERERESGKRDTLKSMDVRRELPQPRPGDTVPSTDLKRVRDEVDMTQKRAFETGSAQLEMQAKRSRDESTPSMHQSSHHPQQMDPSRPNHIHPSMKRARDSSSNGSGDMGYPPISQPKRPREGTDPMMDLLDSNKRPREPKDSTLLNEFDSSGNSSGSDNKLKFPFQEAAKAPQTKLPPHTNFSTSASQKHFQHKPSSNRLPSSNEMDRSKSLLHPKQDFAKEKSFEMQHPPSLGISPYNQRSKSPLDNKIEVRSPEISRKIADAISGQPSSHLFSPEDDREDSALPSDITFSLEVPTHARQEKVISPLMKQHHLQQQMSHSSTKPQSQELTQPTLVSTPTKSPITPNKLPLSSGEKRTRTSSNSSDPALVPVVRKLEDTPGFQSMFNKNSGTFKLEKESSAVPLTPGKDTPMLPVKKETDLKSLLAESTAVPTVATPIKPEPVPSIFDPMEEPSAVPPAEMRGDHHHKKKKKEKHGKKDKEKSKEEKKHKHKKKDKDKSKERRSTEESSSPMTAAPIKLTIPKEKLDVSSVGGIKIKIPKERLKVEEPIPPPVQPISSGGIKIKIGNELISERRLPETPEMKKRNDSQASRGRGHKQNGHQDSRKVPLKGESGSLHPSPGCRQ